MIGSRRGALSRLAFLALAAALAQAASAQEPAADRSYWDYDLGALDAPLRVGPQCPVFFDDDPATAALPKAPPLDDLDRAVLRACGPLGGRVTVAEFRALLADHFESLRPGLPAAWQGLAHDDVAARLKRLWLTHQGFDHIFCGEWDDGSIGGLHFRGRFLQLQSEAKACYMPSAREEIVEGQIYSLGVTSADGRYWHPIKGYALNQSAADLFGLATRAAEACCRPGDGWARYRTWHSKAFYKPSAEGGVEILNRVVCRADDPADPATIGLITIYSDATPDSRGEICPIPPE